jgi:shikimate 5-dehydrogenase
MDRFGLIGHPIDHSLSPRLFRAAYGGKYAYDLIQTPDFDEAWRRFLADYKSINVTTPFKKEAFGRAAGLASPACVRIGASNLLVKTPEGIRAWNSDYLGVKKMLEPLPRGTAAVIGFGGAGKAALAAAEDLGFETRLWRHAEIAGGVEADVILYTLPHPVAGIDRLSCATLIEANYRQPCLTGHPGYVSGRVWLLQQAATGYALMTGEEPDLTAMEAICKL